MNHHYYIKEVGEKLIRNWWATDLVLLEPALTIITSNHLMYVLYVRWSHVCFLFSFSFIWWRKAMRSWRHGGTWERYSKRDEWLHCQGCCDNYISIGDTLAATLVIVFPFGHYGKKRLGAGEWRWGPGSKQNYTIKYMYLFYQSTTHSPLLYHRFVVVEDVLEVIYFEAFIRVYVA